MFVSYLFVIEAHGPANGLSAAIPDTSEFKGVVWSPVTDASRTQCKGGCYRDNIPTASAAKWDQQAKTFTVSLTPTTTIDGCELAEETYEFSNVALRMFAEANIFLATLKYTVA